MFYLIDEKRFCHKKPEEKHIAIISVEEAINCDFVQKYMTKVPGLFLELHFSKLDIFSDFFYGFINIPEILIGSNAMLTFICDSWNLIFIDRNNFAAECFENTLKLYGDNMHSCESVLYYMLGNIIFGDLEKMNAIQQNLANLEQDILNNNIRNPLTEITGYRNDTMKLYHYYIQLAGICGKLKDNMPGFFDEDAKKLFDILLGKINLFSKEAQQIWEYTSQIRDVYQQQLDVHQNAIMKFLTIVTTIFMPLTLITGWYGMNFSYMPELHWHYGYLLVFVLSILLVIVLFVIFKKKKWW